MPRDFIPPFQNDKKLNPSISAIVRTIVINCSHQIWPTPVIETIQFTY